MELKETRNWFYALTFLWVIILFGLGSWWLYLVFQLHSTLSQLNIPELGEQERFLNMMRWEGSFFFILLFLLGTSLFIMYFRDLKKSRALGAFFASLSHELKTPLASIRLEAEVIKDLIEDESHSHEQLSQLTARLIEDTYKLESELEKSLQLSRLEQEAPLSLMPVGLDRYLKKHLQKLPPHLKVNVHLPPDTQEILADELAINMVFRNLFENTLRHHKNPQLIEITASREEHLVKLTYDDHGGNFKGDANKLGRIFYKFNSSKGSGIGLYLIKTLMGRMGGKLNISNSPRLIFTLYFRAPQGDNHE